MKTITRTILPCLLLSLSAAALADRETDQNTNQQQQIASADNANISGGMIAQTSYRPQTSDRQAGRQQLQTRKPAENTGKNDVMTPQGKLLSTRFSQRSSYTSYRDEEKSDSAACVYSQNTLTYSCP